MRPHRLHLNVTARCNVSCGHCYRDDVQDGRDPSLESLDAILGQFKALTRSYHELGTHLITLGGGEPTIRPDLEQVVRLAVRRHFKVRLVTNGMLVDDRRAVSLRDAGLSAVQVSLDGATAATHELVRGPGSWARAMRGVEAFKRARVLTLLGCVLLPEVNLDEAPKLLDLARSKGIAGAKFARPIAAGRAVRNQVRLAGDYWDAYRGVLAHAQATRPGRLLMFLDPLAHLLREAEPGSCSGLWGLSTDLCQCNNTELVEVDACTGEVTYCRLRKSLGNLRQLRLEDLWHSHPVLDAIRRRTPVGACQGCVAWEGCRGGCPAVVNGRRDDPVVQDDGCPRVAASGAPQALPARGAAHPRAIGNREKLFTAGRRFRDALTRLALR
jgi:radical SAM protein with 4Fe4S-binding SPASM domain